MDIVKKVFDLQIDDQKYTSLHPSEDYIGNVRNLFVVADGITRDPIGIADFSNIKLDEVSKAYPNPSPARIASALFVEKLLEYKGPNINSLEEFSSVFKYGNKCIKELNEEKNPNPDYLENDYWSCVAAAAYIKDNKLFWGVIGDCQIKVFDANGNMKFDSPNSVNIFEKFFYGPENQRGDFDWSKAESRILIRKEYRNNPSKTFKGKKIGYGALTGEATADEFMYFGELELSSDDLIMLFSDGFEQTVQHPDFFKHANQAITEGNMDKFKDWSINLGTEHYNKFGHERSILIIAI